MRDTSWTLAALLYGALIDALGFGPKKNPRRLLPRFVIDDMIARVRPFEALVRRLLFVEAQTLTVKLRAVVHRQFKPKPPPETHVTQYTVLPHNPLAFRHAMLPHLAPLTIVRIPHPLDGDPASWKHVRFCVGSGDYPQRDPADRGPSGPHPAGARERSSTKSNLRTPGGPEGPRSWSRSVPWYKLTDIEKEARRLRRGDRNYAATLRRERAEALAAMPPAPQRIWTAADFADISTVAIARRLEALARVIADPAPYAKRIALKLARKPELAARIAKRVARRAHRHVSDAFRAVDRWLDAGSPPVLAAPCADTS